MASEPSDWIATVATIAKGGTHENQLGAGDFVRSVGGILGGRLGDCWACRVRQRVNNTHAKLLECVTLDGAQTHRAALQAIADDNGGTRATGTPGYDASVEYVVEQLEAAGYQVELDAFPFAFFPPALLQQLTPVDAEYETGVYHRFRLRDVTAAVTPVDIVLDLPRDPVTSGCEVADFAGFPAGGIALIQRGTCTFGTKALNAEAAGASGAARAAGAGAGSPP